MGVNDLFIIIKAIDGFRLNLESFLNLDNFEICEFSVPEFKIAVDKVLLLSSSNLVSLKFNITSDSIKFSTYNYFENSYLNSEIECKSSGDIISGDIISRDIIFELNGEHIASMIKTLQEPTMFILFNIHRREIFFINSSRDLFYINIKLLKIN